MRWATGLGGLQRPRLVGLFASVLLECVDWAWYWLHSIGFTALFCAYLILLCCWLGTWAAVVLLFLGPLLAYSRLEANCPARESYRAAQLHTSMPIELQEMRARPLLNRRSTAPKHLLLRTSCEACRFYTQPRRLLRLSEVLVLLPPAHSFMAPPSSSAFTFQR